MRGFEAYGVHLHGDLNLEAYVPVAASRRAVRSIDVLESPAPRFTPAVRWPFAHSHGRQLTALSDQAFRGAVTGQSWWLDIEDTARFHWTVGQSTLGYERGPAGNHEALSFWLIHTILPAFLALEETYHFLHAAASRIGDEAVLILGPSGSGKSTLLSALLEQRCALIGDDKIAIQKQNGGFSAIPSHDRYRPYRRHLDLGLKARSVSRAPVPVHSLIRLQPAQADADVRLVEIQGANKLKTVSEHLLFAFSQSAPVHFGFLTELLNHATVIELQVPRDLGRVEEVGAAVVQHFHR